MQIFQQLSCIYLTFLEIYSNFSYMHLHNLRLLKLRSQHKIGNQWQYIFIKDFMKVSLNWNPICSGQTIRWKKTIGKHTSFYYIKVYYKSPSTSILLFHSSTHVMVELYKRHCYTDIVLAIVYVNLLESGGCVFFHKRWLCPFST